MSIVGQEQLVQRLRPTGRRQEVVVVIALFVGLALASPQDVRCAQELATATAPLGAARARCPTYSWFENQFGVSVGMVWPIEASPRVRCVVPGGRAAEAGVVPGDRVVGVYSDAMGEASGEVAMMLDERWRAGATVQFSGEDGLVRVSLQ